MDNKFKPGWSSVWAIYPKRNLSKGIWRPLLLTAISAVCYCLSSKSALYLIGLIAGWITSGFPSIIGFVLSGYVLIVGFSDSKFMRNLAKPQMGDYTLFQILSSTFAVVIAIMVITYAIGALYDLMVSCNMVLPQCMELFCIIYNFIAFILIVFAFFYSVVSLIDIVINIFNMGQLANLIAEQNISNNSD